MRIALQNREHARQVYYGAVFEIKKEIPGDIFVSHLEAK